MVTKYLGSFFAAHISCDGDTTTLQLPDPIEWFRPFVEAEGPGVFVVRSTDNVTGARPRDGVKAHGARFSAGNQLVGWLPFSAEIEVFNGALREYDRHHLSVSNGAVSSYKEVYAGCHEPAVMPIEDHCPERSSGSMVHVGSREPDRKPHPILGGWVCHIRVW